MPELACGATAENWHSGAGKLIACTLPASPPHSWHWNDGQRWDWDERDGDQDA